MTALTQQLNKIRGKIGIKDRGSKYLWLRNQADLNVEQQQKLVQVLEKSECRKIVYKLKAEFRDIYQTSKTIFRGRRKLEKWLRIAQPFSSESVPTI